jgi:hypothetical protein
MSLCGVIIDYTLLFEPNGAFVVSKVKSIFIIGLRPQLPKRHVSTELSSLNLTHHREEEQITTRSRPSRVDLQLSTPSDL